MQDTLPQTLQPSLEAPPVYRRFLGGGTDVLRFSALELGIIGGLGILTALLSEVLVDSRPAWEVVSGGFATTIAALSTAAIATRWLGSRIGLFSGCLYLLSGQTILATASPSDNRLAAMSTMAVAAFAVASIAGRLPLVSSRWPSRVFYALTAAVLFFNGAAPAVAILVICFFILATVQNGRGIRFFADPLGIIVLAIVALAAWLWLGLTWNTAWPGGSVFSTQAWSQLAERFAHLLAVEVPLDVLPWGPLALVAIVVGIGQGHYNTPFGRFLTVWMLAPLGIAFMGLIDKNTAAALVFPPLSIFGGIGLFELWAKISRMRRRR